MGASLVILVPDRDRDQRPGHARWFDEDGREWSPVQFNILTRCPRCDRQAFELWVRHLEPDTRRCAYCVEFRNVRPVATPKPRAPTDSP